MNKVKQTPQEIADEIATGRNMPFTAFGKEWQGDVFYSDIYSYTKKLPNSAYEEVCNLLRTKGYYVHS